MGWDAENGSRALCVTSESLSVHGEANCGRQRRPNSARWKRSWRANHENDLIDTAGREADTTLGFHRQKVPKSWYRPR